MSSLIQIARSGNIGFVPNANTLLPGELFINYKDGIIFFVDANQSLLKIQAVPVGS